VLLEAGDYIRTADGWIAVEDVYDTRTYETVYNLRVADFHTYFVGDDDTSAAVWAHNTCDDAFEALARSPEMQARGVTKAMLQASPNFNGLFSPAYNVRHTSLEDFKQALELALDRSGWLSTGQYLSATTALAVKAAAEIPRRATGPIDTTLENPYAEGTTAWAQFQTGVVGNPQNRSYYRRIQALVRQGVSTAWRLVRELPGGSQYGRYSGLAYQLTRTEAYRALGQLQEVEMPLGGGEVDICLTGGQLVDTKAWTTTWWNTELDESARTQKIDELRAQIHRYLDATSTVSYKLRLEFKYFVPPEVTALIAEFTSQAMYQGRLQPVVRS